MHRLYANLQANPIFMHMECWYLSIHFHISTFLFFNVSVSSSNWVLISNQFFWAFAEEDKRQSKTKIKQFLQ